MDDEVKKFVEYCEGQIKCGLVGISGHRFADQWVYVRGSKEKYGYELKRLKRANATPESYLRDMAALNDCSIGDIAREMNSINLAVDEGRVRKVIGECRNMVDGRPCVNFICEGDKQCGECGSPVNSSICHHPV